MNQWRRQDFVTGEEVWVHRGSRVRSPPEAGTFTAVHRKFVGFGICRVIRRSSMTMKAHTYYIIFGRPPIGGKLPPSGGATAVNAENTILRPVLYKSLMQAAPCFSNDSGNGLLTLSHRNTPVAAQK